MTWNMETDKYIKEIEFLKKEIDIYRNVNQGLMKIRADNNKQIIELQKVERAAKAVVKVWAGHKFDTQCPCCGAAPSDDRQMHEEDCELMALKSAVKFFGGDFR